MQSSWPIPVDTGRDRGEHALHIDIYISIISISGGPGIFSGSSGNARVGCEKKTSLDERRNNKPPMGRRNLVKPPLVFSIGDSSGAISEGRCFDGQFRIRSNSWSKSCTSPIVGIGLETSSTIPATGYCLQESEFQWPLRQWQSVQPHNHQARWIQRPNRPEPRGFRTHNRLSRFLRGPVPRC